MGSCSSASTVPYDGIDKPQTSVHSSGGKRGGRSSNLFPSSSEESDEGISDNEDSFRSRITSKMPSPEELQEEPQPTPSPQPPPRPTPVQPKIPSLCEIPLKFRKVIYGRMDDDVHVEDRIIYVYHCANFSDSQKERSAVQLKVYPKLREYCARNGCELHVVDFLWGLRDEFIHGHVMRNASAQYLTELCERDKNVIVTVFLFEKYGNFWCPLQLDLDSVSIILKKVTEDDKHFFLSWYQLDDNLSPPAYVLQPIEWKVPRYKDSKRDVYKEGFREWEKELIRLRNVLVQATGQEFQQKYCTSAIEKEMDASVFSDNINRDNILWLKRTFTKLNMESGSPYLCNFLDLHRDRLDDNAQVKLKTLSSRLGDRINPEHKIDVSLGWDEKAMTSSNLESTKYLDEVCDKYEKVLQGMIDNVIKKKQEHYKTKIKLAHKGISRILQTDLTHNARKCQKLAKTVIGYDYFIARMEAYIRTGQLIEEDEEERKAEVVKPLCLHGSVGSGKSTMAATIAQNSCSIEGWTSSVCVLRFIGASIECETLDQVLISIGEHITLVSQLQPKEEVHAKPLTDVLHNLLPKVPAQNPLLIIVDGLDLLNLELENFEWLPRQLPPHVRLVLTVTSGTKFQQILAQYLADDAIDLDIPSLSYEVTDSMIQKELQGINHSITEYQMDKVLTSLEGNMVPTTIKLNALSAATWSSFTKINDLIGGNDVKSQLKKMLENLDQNFGRCLVERCMLYLAVSRYGLSDPEMNDLLSQHEPSMREVYMLHPPVLLRIPVYYWAAIKAKLDFLLNERTHCGILVTSIASRALKDIVIERYANDVNTARQELLEYFDGNKSSGKNSLGKSKQSNNSRQGKRIQFKSQPIKWDEAFNGRKLGEVPFLLTNHEKDLLRMLKECFFNWEWLCGRLQSSNPWQLSVDLDVCHKELLSGDNEINLKELIFLEEWIKKLSWILCMDPSQFGSQLYMNIRSGQLVLKDDLPMCNQLYEAALRSLPTLLAPEQENTFGLSTDQEKVITNLHLVKGDENHIISLATQKGEVKIWNLHTKEVVRTFIGMQEPKDLKMLDMGKVVLLCNRELVLYDLDEGKKLLKLKGVLNIKMPFFGIHDNEHTIAMARNRMYVNMMSNVTGEMVTTFKVGEDRFLNSLIVSEQGNICVCGDAVQKPFPLLVWNLHQRKLIYDLRITGHEFLTKMAAITSGGEYAVVVCREIEDPDPNCIMVYDLQTGFVFRKWKHDFNTTSVAVSSKTSLVISGHEDGSVVVWDLTGGSSKHNLRGHCRGPDVIRMSQSGTHAMTYDSTGLDTTVWYWNVVDGLTIGCFCTATGISCGEISADGNSLVVGLPGSSEIKILRSPGYSTPVNVGVFGDSSRMHKTYDMHGNI